MNEIHKEGLLTCPDCKGDQFVVETALTIICAVCGYKAGLLLPMGESKK